MKKHLLLAAGLTVVLAMVGLCGCGTVPTRATIEGISLTSQQEGIWVSGQGKVTVVPDIATLRLGVEAQQASVAEAQTEASEAMNRVMDALTDNGVAKKDIQTQYFSIRKVTRWDNEKQQEIVIGYRVSNIVTVKIRDIDKVGIIIDAVAEAGGDLTRIDSVGFSVDDPSAYYEEAREKAIADAKTKATQLAEFAGVSLGNPIYIAEGVYYPPVMRGVYEEAAMPAPAAAPPPISPGEMEISLTVQVVYAILK